MTDINSNLAGETGGEAAPRPAGEDLNPGARRARGGSSGSRIDKNSVLYSRVIPILILIMGVLTATLILFAAGVLLGLVPFQ